MYKLELTEEELQTLLNCLIGEKLALTNKLKELNSDGCYDVVISKELDRIEDIFKKLDFS